MSKELKLTDLQIMLIIKNALDYNAEIVKYASFIYGQDIKDGYRKRLHSDFTKLAKDYSKKVEEILNNE